jgi:hypothetical protein
MKITILVLLSSCLALLFGCSKHDELNHDRVVCESFALLAVGKSAKKTGEDIISLSSFTFAEIRGLNYIEPNSVGAFVAYSGDWKYSDNKIIIICIKPKLINGKPYYAIGRSNGSASYEEESVLNGLDISNYRLVPNIR